MRDLRLFMALFGLVTLVLVLLLAGCNSGNTGPTGATGATGPAGSAGPPGPVSGVSTSLVITINDVKIGKPSMVDFTITNQSGYPYAGVPVSALEVIIAKLVPGTNGDPDEWQNYINKVAKPNGIGPGTQTAIQATYDSGGTLADHGDGTYTYTFGTEIENVTQPLSVSYDPSLVHRVAINIRSSTLPPANNGIYTLIPATGATTGFNADDIVDTATCNQCHDHLAVHGGPRQDVHECVLCHNAGSTDPSSGNTLDFIVMIHKIHDGANLPSVLAGTSYIIWGYQNSKNDFSDVKWPQNIENCTKCHAPNNPNAPDSSYYASVPSMAACGSCHDDVDFAQGAAGGHPGGVVTDNSQCTVCHAENRIAGSVDQSHTIAAKVAAQDFQYNILGITPTTPGSYPVITFSVTNPQKNNAAYNLATDPEFTGCGSACRLYIDLAWSNTDFTNTDATGAQAGNPTAQAVSFNALTATANGNGTYTITSPVQIPTNAIGSGTVGIEGHPATDSTTPGTYNVAVPVTSATQAFSITDPLPVPRRADVVLANCQKCHGQNDGLSLHGNNRTDNLTLCEMCHNPNETDLTMRPADPDATPNGVNTAAVDGLEQRPIDFKYMIHAIHGADFRATNNPSDPYIVYAYGNNPTDFSSVGFPGILGDCTQCHSSTGYTLPLPSGVLGTTVDTHATVQTANASGTKVFYGNVANTAAYDRITPTAAACSACHDDALTEAHMQQNGASFSITQSLINNGSTTETCVVCHGSGAIADVSVVHQIGGGN
ncbi:MAG TPA: OmcA/MtrC family decaheme c-type cytochrome [Gammaproteobacteria bacterium]|nr:OmcA/MtrC family decaheme c-type cytochrome [Gammaproteobacteria bacterium]